MKKELELWQFAAERLKRKQSVMLLVVAESSGSSPGRQGFKMAVAGNDDLKGSIGGGLMEINLVEQARQKIAGSPDEIFINRQVHRKNSPHSSGMICSGEQTIVFYKLSFDDLKTVRKIIVALKNHRRGTLQISANGFRVLENQPAETDYKFERRNESDFAYEEKIGCKNELFIVGGGHCALALSELMSKMDFYIHLFDDRADLNTLEKNRFVHKKCVIESYERIDDFIPAGANHYVVVMTLGYESDEIVIRRLLEKEYKYFGVMGSQVKMKTLLKNLESEGCSPENLKRIRTPIGLEINSRTPEEIAVSIAAEIIAVKNAKN